MRRSRDRDLATMAFGILSVTFLPLVGSLVALVLSGGRWRLAPERERAETERMRRVGLVLACVSPSLVVFALLIGLLSGRFAGGKPGSRPIAAAPRGVVICRGGRIEPAQLVGRSLASAEHLAQTSGCLLRVTVSNGRRRAGPMQALSYRIDVASEGGVVTRVFGVG